MAKVNISFWRTVIERLPTRTNLASRGITVPSMLCPICQELPETESHLFTGCPTASLLWSIVGQWCFKQCRPFFDVKDLLLDVPDRSSTKSKEFFVDVVIRATVWTLWKNRNQLVFQERRNSMQTLIVEVKSLSFLWVKARARHWDVGWDEWCRFNFVM
ncbi:hypothetical protein SSX86_032388 [Deinandra increscens subsp. villosa]|uniref:Reverse transcriptase zinc-binding domain-containing protein n=1 Tax=Deinandra increscens subsp. villosa TaxID=3103831 RepID=A0AAP0GGV3_9ASTR